MFNLFGKRTPHADVGKRIVLGHMNDPDPIPDGATGTIVEVDGIGNYHVQWDDGRKLAVIPGEDTFTIDHETPIQ